jgi:hypothetical protein
VNPGKSFGGNPKKSEFLFAFRVRLNPTGLSPFLSFCSLHAANRAADRNPVDSAVFLN